MMSQSRGRLNGVHPVLGDVTPFVSRLLIALAESGLRASEWARMDHIAYRVETEERYRSVKSMLLEADPLVSEELVNGRPISVFKLAEPFEVCGYRIDAFELPAPGRTPYAEGFEHAEFVIKDSLLDFLKRHESLTFDKSEMEKKLNPGVSLILPGGAAKFREIGILEVVGHRQQER